MGANKKILITGVGGDIGQSIVKCLKDSEYAVTLIGCDIDSYAASRDTIDTFYTAPRAADGESYMRFIWHIIEKDSIDYVLPTTEAEILFFHRHRTAFNNTASVLIHAPHIIETFFDKYSTIQFFKKNGVPYPRTFTADTYQGQLPFPLLLKQRYGCGGRGVLVVHDAEELAFYLNRNKNMLVQENVGSESDEYTVGVFCDGAHTHAIAFKRTLGYGSLSKIAELAHDTELADLAKKITRRADMRGSWNIQFRKTEQGYVPFEVNARFSSTVYVRHYFGFRDVAWWLAILMGASVSYQPRYLSGVAVRALDEKFFNVTTIHS